MKDHLLIWEPLVENPFCRRNNEMSLVKLSFEKDFVLVFEDIKSKEEYTFSYRGPADKTRILYAKQILTLKSLFPYAKESTF